MDAACMDTDEGAPDLELMMLALGNEFFLFSPVTGELQRMDGEGPHELDTDEGDNGAMTVVSGPQRAKMLAIDLMTVRLELVADGVVSVVAPDQPRHTISEWRSRYTTCAISITVGGDASNLPRFDCETYHFMSSVPGWAVFWVYGFVTDAIGLTEARNLRYNTLVGPWKVKVADVLMFVDTRGTTVEDHFRVSFRAAWAKAQVDIDDVGDAPLGFATTQEPDHSCSSFALLVVLAGYACKPVHGRRATKVPAKEIQLRGQCVFMHIIRAFLNQDTEFAYVFQGEVEVTFRIRRSCSGTVPGVSSALAAGGIRGQEFPIPMLSRHRSSCRLCFGGAQTSAQTARSGGASHGAQGVRRR